MLIVRQKTKKELILGKLILLNSKKKKKPKIISKIHFTINQNFSEYHEF